MERKIAALAVLAKRKRDSDDTIDVSEIHIKYEVYQQLQEKLSFLLTQAKYSEGNQAVIHRKMNETEVLITEASRLYNAEWVTARREWERGRTPTREEVELSEVLQAAIASAKAAYDKAWADHRVALERAVDRNWDAVVAVGVAARDNAIDQLANAEAARRQKL